MKRRAFFGFLGGVAGWLGFLKDVAYADQVLRLQAYRGYRVRWTGWKQCQNDDREFGQWLAYPEINGGHDPSRPFFYVSSPGNSGPYFRGATFDISIQEGQRVITWDTHPRVKEKARAKAGKRLVRLIDDWYAGKITCPPWLGSA